MKANELRSRAEEAVLLTRREIATLPVASVQQLVHELQVHQIELEMQNSRCSRSKTRSKNRTVTIAVSTKGHRSDI